eukprot:m.278928 g.278928  ORF g.278928 m.278928 type:complete len:144 (+) comp19793_c1_seq6:47-478(+)
MSESKKGKTVKKKNETKKKPGKVQDDIYIVEKLVDKREHKHGKLGTIIQYKVKWEGYPEEESTWEPEWNISEVMKHAYNTHGIFDYVVDVPSHADDIHNETQSQALVVCGISACTFHGLVLCLWLCALYAPTIRCMQSKEYWV